MYQSCTLASNCNVVPIAPGPDNCDQLQYTLCWSTTASCNIPRGNRWRGEHGTLEGHILVALINHVYSLSLKDKKKKFPWFVTQKLRFPSVPPEKILLPSHTTIITPVSLTCRQKNKLSIFSQNSHLTLIFFFSSAPSSLPRIGRHHRPPLLPSHTHSLLIPLGYHLLTIFHPLSPSQSLLFSLSPNLAGKATGVAAGRKTMRRQHHCQRRGGNNIVVGGGLDVDVEGI